MHRRLTTVAALPLAVLCALGLSCKLMKVGDPEQPAGGSTKPFDPYQGPSSGAIRLALQDYNGCAVYPTGEPVPKGAANFPYPSSCPRYPYQDPQPRGPDSPIPLISGETYFLNELTLMDGLWNVHTDPSNPDAVADWMKNQSRFKELDWSGLSIVDDVWQPSWESPSPLAFGHERYFGNAAWQLKTDDYFTVELLDTDGTTRLKTTYNRSDFLAENQPGSHTILVWDINNLAAPPASSDTTVAQAPPSPIGWPPTQPISYQSILRVDMEVSTHPTKTFTIPSGLKGDGAIRVTWSQMPNTPFYFPVTVVDQKDVAATCYSGADPTKLVPCTYGLKPEAVFTRPKNGQYYEPGESFQIRLAAKDGAGNYLHKPDLFPSWNEYITGNSNGLLYHNVFEYTNYYEQNTSTGWAISGPKQLVKPQYELKQDNDYFTTTGDVFSAGLRSSTGGFNIITGGGAVANNAIPGGRDAHPSTTVNVTLPPDAKPGTYTLFWKVNRGFMGERVTKTLTQDFQVGQAQPTQYPGRVGNCQICHRGVISLDNVRHGIDVNHIEGCVSCHSRELMVTGREPFVALIHRIHMQSHKFPLAKNACVTCHLTRESALRPSYIVCSSCHPAPHGDKYKNLTWTTDWDPKLTFTVYSNCADQCHRLTPPTQHILPSN